MGKIFKLDKNLANQISAGEVVERPYCVVKELVENSIDANSSIIKVEVFSGGKEKIIITDNGNGIGYDDLEICLEKYTTSKIKSLQDLYNVMTFGFRGEALASISSVSQIEIISKTQDSQVGYKLNYDNETGTKISKTMSENGTKIEVNNLFFNTPARLNYLKQDKTEYLKILGYLQEISISMPHISFELVNDGKQIFKFPKNETQKTRIYNIYGEELFLNLLELDLETTGMKITGFISDPKINFTNKNRQHIFVNTRPINSPLISKAINDAYNRFIPHNCYPAYVLNIEINPTLIDVNVHPKKQEIRFAQEQNIFRAVYNCVLTKLEKVSLIDENFSANQTDFIQDFSTNIQKEGKINFHTPSGTNFKSYSPYTKINTNPKQTDISQSIEFSKIFLENSLPEAKKDLFDNGDLHYTKLGKIVGQAFNSYIIVENEGGLFVYDQHALAERIIYEKLVKNDYKASFQKLLVPENIKLNPKEIDILTSNLDSIKDLGFEIDFLSNGIISVLSIPDFIKFEDLKNIFLGVLEDISSGNAKSNTLLEVKNKIFAYTACRSAIKFGDKLNLFEINKLLNDSVEGYSSTCPHGRPVIFKIDLDDLKNRYER